MNTIRIDTCGTSDWPRYFIVRGGEYWTGSTWTQCFRHARLFAHLPLVTAQYVGLVERPKEEG